MLRENKLYEMIVGRIFFIVFLFLSFLHSEGQERKLDYFTSEGLRNSPLVRDLKGQVSSNGVDSLLVRAMNKPKVEFRSYAFYAPVVNHYGYSEILTNIANLTSVVSVYQPIFNKKTTEGNILKTKIQGQSLTNTLRLTELSLKKDITAAYLDVCSIYADISVDEELLSFAQEQKKILKSLTDHSIYKQTDFLSFMLGSQELEFQANELNIEYRKQISDLYILCGIKDTGTFFPVIPDLGTESPSGHWMSPLFLRFYIDSLRISNEYLLIDRNYHPKVSWFSDAGLINNDPRVIYQNFGLSVGLNFTLPVYDGNQRKLNSEKLKYEEDIRTGYSEAYKREYSQQYQQLSAQQAQIRALLPAIKSQVEDSRLIVDQEKELVYKGVGSITDYLIAMKNYLSVRKRSKQYEIKLLQIQNEINFLNEN